MFRRQLMSKVLHMIVNQVLFCYENVASEVFYFLECWNVVHYQISKESIKFWAAKPTKIIKISDLFENADVIKIFC